MRIPAPHRCRVSGFTLLELVAVMSIMMLIIGLGFASFAFFDAEDPFEKPAERLSLMSKFALNAAVLQRRTMTIAFDKEGFGVLGASLPGGSRYNVPENMKVFIHRFGGKRWDKAEGQSWLFGEQGICEPIRVRFESDAGSREMAFHPLTGAVID
ncbi:MAG TPA: prepilin-type N-terminal cleavage/methylation domain-containing protein [Prosthecobacter sp.]